MPRAFPSSSTFSPNCPSSNVIDVEQLLTQLAGEWAPLVSFQGEDEIARKIRRDVWAAGRAQLDGKSLVTIVRKHTATANDGTRIGGLVVKLAADFATREAAMKELLALGQQSAAVASSGQRQEPGCGGVPRS